MRQQNVFTCQLVLAVPPTDTEDKPDLLYQHLSDLPGAYNMEDSQILLVLRAVHGLKSPYP